MRKAQSRLGPRMAGSSTLSGLYRNVSLLHRKERSQLFIAMYNALRVEHTIDMLYRRQSTPHQSTKDDPHMP